MKRVLLWTVGIVGLLGLVGVIVACGGGAIAVGDMVDASSPVWTPDGEHIVFVGSIQASGGDPDENDLYEIDPDGQNEHRLTDGAHAITPAVSPDGTRIAFTASTAILCAGSCDYINAVLFVARADGSSAKPLRFQGPFDKSDPAWSPDGKQLAFSRLPDFSDPADPWRLLVARADGNDGPRRLVRTDPDTEQHPSWSPDGRFIAYAGTKGIYVISSAGGKPRLVAAGYYLPAWAPNTNRLAVVHRRGRFGPVQTIEILQLSGRRHARRTRVFTLSGLQEVSAIAWEPRERKIVFSGSDIPDCDGLFVLALKLGSVTALTNPRNNCNVHAHARSVGR